MSREFQPSLYYSPPNPQVVNGDPVATLEKLAQSGKYLYLLAYAYDGVIWGVIEEGKYLALSSDPTAFPGISPKLREETLWEARLFGKDAEWYLWKTDEGWLAREIVDTGNQRIEVFDENCVLWGTNSGDQKNNGGFFLAEEIGQGIRHAPPKPLTGRHSLKLKVRHYLDYDEAGAVFVKYSRLVDLIDGGVK